MRRERPHVVHTHTAKAGLIGRAAAFAARVPVVVHTFHGHVLHGYFGARTSRAFLRLERAAARLSSVTLTVSDTVRAELIGYGVDAPERIRVLPDGLDLTPYAALEPLRGTLRAELGLAPGTPLAGVVARVVPIKNHALFLEAARRVAEALPRARFVIVGDGELRTAVQARAGELGLGDRVHFLGWRRDMPAIYADLDVLVVSSDNEGTPGSLIEAMAARVPVVSTRVGGVPDVLRGGALGTLVPPRDPAARGDAITAALRDRDEERLDAARRHVVERHGAERLVRDVRALYAELLASRADRQ
jgi:glycosyltransferase involved in cell wall biosynthesis